MKKRLFVFLAGFIIAGCSAIDLKPNARNVMISPNPPPKGCVFLGQVVGNQGNFFTGMYTPNKNLEIGSMNDMKNQAADLGANYVQTIKSRAGSTGSINERSGSFMQTNVLYTGNAYKCAQSALNS